MSDRETLLSLATRCEQATGPDREMDADIAVAALGYEREFDERALYHKGERYSLREPDYYDLAGQIRELPWFTASLDAALTLVPAGWTWEIHQGGRAEVCNYLSDAMEHGKADEAATPALALCAAALKARAAECAP